MTLKTRLKTNSKPQGPLAGNEFKKDKSHFFMRSDILRFGGRSDCNNRQLLRGQLAYA